MKGVESICETWVSIKERHSPSTRVNHEQYEYKTLIAINGPEVVHCDSLVKESMEDYWRQFLRSGDRGGHFVRRSDKILNLTKQAPRLPFMAK